MCAPQINYSNDHQLHHRDNRAATDATRPHACPLPGCTRQFKRRFTLKEHVKTHTGEKPFVCPVPFCHKRFTTLGNLTRHKRIHPWLETSFECLIIGCGCSFPSETKLERHMSLVHFGLSAHLCPHANCGGAFSTAGNLRRHLRQRHARAHRSALMMRTFPQEETRVVTSPVAVDRFAEWNAHDYRQGFVCAPPPPMGSTPAYPVLPAMDPDRDLLEALVSVFESEAVLFAI